MYTVHSLQTCVVLTEELQALVVVTNYFAFSSVICMGFITTVGAKLLIITQHIVTIMTIC